MKLSIFIFFILSGIILAQEREIKGTVLDSETGRPLPYASILLNGTNRGTVSNLDGEFTLKLESSNHTLVFRYVGYKSDSLVVSATLKKDITIRLIRQPFLLPEILITSENPAYRIIREAIRRKRINKLGLNNYEYSTYSKNVMESAGEIAMVQETISRVFKLKDNIEKEFILKTHKTENRKKSFNLNLAADLTNSRLPDFSADTLRLLMNKVYLPINDDAFDYYDYKLLKSIETKSAPVYEISVIPRSNIRPLLEGTIYIEGDSYSIIKVDLKASKGVRFPFVQNLSMEFKQSAAKFDGYWLPDYFEMNATVGFNMGGLIGIEPITFHEVNSITDYKINQTIPDSVLKAVKSNFGGYVPDTSQRKIPPVEISSNEINTLRPVPLTKSEIKAFATIDTTMTIEKSVKLTGALARVVPKNSNESSGGGAFSKISNILFKYVYVNNNRVEYYSLGARYQTEFLGNKIYTNGFAAYSAGLKKGFGSLLLGYKFDGFLLSRIELEIFRRVQDWQPLNPYPQIFNSAAVLLGFEDQFNYYYSYGYRIGIVKNILKNFSAGIHYISDKESSLREYKYLSIFNPGRKLRINPTINEGNDNRVKLSLLYGKSPFELQLIPDNGIITEVDYSSKLLKSNFDYLKIFFAGQLKLKTIYNELFLSPYLQINLEAGLVNGNYGIQHMLSPISALGFYSPVTSFKGLKPYQFAGDKMIALHIEHNWRTIIFQALGMDFLTNLDLDIITGAAALRITNHSNYLNHLTQKNLYWEVYAGISRILALINFEISYNSLKKVTATLSTAVVF